MNLSKRGNAMVMVGVVVAVLVVAGIAIYFVANKDRDTSKTEPTKTNQPKPIVRDSSNASIDKDMASFDAEIEAYQKDASGVDGSMNDKPDNLQ